MGIACSSFAFSQIAYTSSPSLYTSAQATRGTALYADKCAVCHGDKLEGGVGPALSGETFSQTAAAEQMTAKSLFTKVSTTMPTGAPASLKQNEYEALLAFLLQTNGFPAGSTPFSKDTPGLDQVKIGHAPLAGEAAATRPE